MPRDLWKLSRYCNSCIYYAHQTSKIYQVLPYSVDFKAPWVLWNPLSKAVLSDCSFIWHKKTCKHPKWPYNWKVTCMLDLYVIFFLLFDTAFMLWFHFLGDVVKISSNPRSMGSEYMFVQLHLSSRLNNSPQSLQIANLWTAEYKAVPNVHTSTEMEMSTFWWFFLLAALEVVKQTWKQG